MSSDTTQTFRRIELPTADFIFGTTAGMREIRQKIEHALQDDLPVLIDGESGTGKEVIGRFLHDHSGRREGPFVKVNCGALQARLLEGEMFGYERGAVGEEARNGSIGIAAGGTLFLDEIGEIDHALQRKLVATLESGHYRRLDGREEVAVNTRFVCATSVDHKSGAQSHAVVQELVGCFAHRVHLLPLRERREDIPQLCEYLLTKFARDFGRPVPHLTAYALEAFQRWRWPGNIRELENWIARIVIFGTEEAMGLELQRQATAWEEAGPTRHRVAQMKMGRARRLRRHS